MHTCSGRHALPFAILAVPARIPPASLPLLPTHCLAANHGHPAGENEQLPSLFNALRMESMPQPDGGAGGGIPPPSAFAAAQRSGSLQVPMQRGGPPLPPAGHLSPPHVTFSDSVHTRTFQQGY